MKLLDENVQPGDKSMEDETQEPYVATPITMFLQQPVTDSEREILHAEITNLRKDRDNALEKVASYGKLINSSNLVSSSVEGNNEACKMMTGISWDVFMKVFLVSSTFIHSSSTNKSSTPLQEQF